MRGNYTILLSLALFLFLRPAAAQTTGYTIRGSLSAPENHGTDGITISLMRYPDSNLVKLEYPDAQGRFLFEQTAAGNYFIHIQGARLSPYSGPVFALDHDDLDLPPVTLSPLSATLREAVVTSAQPLIQRDFDKTVVNVGASIQAAGNTAFDVLRQAPGISIDQNDNISMRGRQGVMVMIDGKRIFMSGTELANLLRGTSAGAVDRIELITNPSARYDAQGSGIIHIRLKKDNRSGSNGSVNGSFGQGRYPKAAAGFSLNHRNKKYNVFGSYNYNNRGDFNDLQLERSFYQQEVFSGAYEQTNLFKYNNNSHNLRVGADYNISAKTVAGITLGGLMYGSERTNENVSRVYDAQRVYSSSFLTSGNNNIGRKNGFLNLNLRQQLDTSGSELSLDLDYAGYGSKDQQDYATRYIDTNGAATRDPYLLHGDLLGSLNIYSVKADYTRPLKNKMRLEAGVKSSLVSADNDLQFRDRSKGGNVLDTTKSNHFLYDENINAAYANLNGSSGKLDWQAGLRMENTNARGRQLTDGKDFNRNYTQLFPSMALNYHLQPKHDLGLSVSRRINRPTYNQLNPFKYFLDPSTYNTGNPYLNPELSLNMELSYTYNQRFIAQLSFTRTTQNMITVLVPVPDQEKVIIQTDLNVGSLEYYAATVTIPLKAGKWLSSANTFNIYYSLYRGEAANTVLRNGRLTFDFNSVNTLTLGKGYTAELNLKYQSPVAYGFITQESFGFVSAGIQKQFWDRRANLKLSISDIFRTSTIHANTEVTGYKDFFYQQFDTRYATLSFSYRFGKAQAAPGRRRTGGVDDEKRRAN